MHFPDGCHEVRTDSGDPFRADAIKFCGLYEPREAKDKQTEEEAAAAWNRRKDAE
jgi:hypothetical protein